MSKPILTQAEALRLFEYRDGNLYWRARPLSDFKTLRACNTWNAKFASNRAGTVSNNYIRCSINDRLYLAHRIIWLIHHGTWPNKIDHIDHDRINNKITNLRSVTHQENMQNQTKAKHNTSGITGVSRHRNKWRVKINRIHLGLFTNKEDAIAARKQAEMDLGFHINHGK
jgi:hypothetical protein